MFTVFTAQTNHVWCHEGSVESSQDSAEEGPPSRTILHGQQPSQDTVYAGTPSVVTLYLLSLGVKANIRSRLDALEVELGTIKALVASKEHEQK